MASDAATDTTAVTGLTADVAALKAQEATLPAGTDTSSIDTPLADLGDLADLAVQLTAVQAALSTASTAVLAVPAAPSAADLSTVRDATEAAVTAAQTALKDSGGGPSRCPDCAGRPHPAGRRLTPAAPRHGPVPLRRDGAVVWPGACPSRG